MEALRVQADPSSNAAAPVSETASPANALKAELQPRSACSQHHLFLSSVQSRSHVEKYSWQS